MNTRATSVAVALLAASGAAHADASVKPSAPPPPGWCAQRYLTALRQAAPAAPPPATRATSYTLGSYVVQLDVPVTLKPARFGAVMVQLTPSGSANDELAQWEPTAQLRWQTRDELESRLKAITSDFMGTTRIESETRPKRVGKEIVQELCAIVRRTPGHATLTDGRHLPMPDSVEWVRGYIFSVGETTFTAVFRLPPNAVAQLAAWEHMLDSVRLTRPPVP